MINQETLRKLTEMKGYAELDFDDCFNLVVDQEYSRRRSNKLDQFIKQATLSDPSASIEHIEYDPDRRLDKKPILELASGNYIKNHHNVILMGASGNGKTWLANALAVQVRRQFHKVKYIRLPEPLAELAVAKYEADCRIKMLIQKYRTIDLLILDEWLLTELPQQHVCICWKSLRHG